MPSFLPLAGSSIPPARLISPDVAALALQAQKNVRYALGYYTGTDEIDVRTHADHPPSYRERM